MSISLLRRCCLHEELQLDNVGVNPFMHAVVKLQQITIRQMKEQKISKERAKNRKKKIMHYTTKYLYIWSNSFFRYRKTSHLKISVVNPRLINVYVLFLFSVISRLGKLKATVKKKFTPFFNDDIINEWIWDKVDSKRRHALKLKQRLMKLQSAGDKTTAR